MKSIRTISILAASLALGLTASAVQNSDLAVAPREAARNWPAFRGTAAAGVADGQGAVAEWDTASGRNIRWTTPIAGFSNSSPIVWGNRVFITTSISASGNAAFEANSIRGVQPVDDLSDLTCKIIALDTRTGNIVWEKDVYKGAPRSKRHPKGSHASSTPVTDGRHLVAMYGTVGILAAYDMEGRQLWKSDLGTISNVYFQDTTLQWGHSSSPIIYKDTAIVQIDQDKNSYVAAYNLDTGKEIWKTVREGELSGWGTPTVVSSKSGDELVTNGTTIRSYDPVNGKLRWTLGPNSSITIPTPIAGPDLIYVMGGYTPVRPIYAVKPGSTGNLTLKTGTTSSDAIAWSNDRDGVYIPTPLLYRGLMYAMNNNSILTAFDAATGKQAYRSRVGTSAFSASPVAADGRIYLANEDGEVFVVRAGGEYAQMAHNTLPEAISATPAISDGLMVVRTVRSLYGIGVK